MKTIARQIAAWILTQMGNMEITELRRQAWNMSQDRSQPEGIRRFAQLVDEAHERDLEASEAKDEAERAEENERYARQVLAWAA
jgi:hypothetical protein